VSELSCQGCGDVLAHVAQSEAHEHIQASLCRVCSRSRGADQSFAM